MNNNRFLELLVKRKSGIITLSEKAELDRCLESNEEDAAVTQLLDNVYNVSYSVNGGYQHETIQKALSQLNDKIDLQNRKPDGVRSRRLWVKLATTVAAAIIIGILGFIFYFGNDAPVAAKSANIVSTKKGSKSSVILPDGTKVWINSDTRLSHDESNWETARNVHLEGEAYFDVVKDEKRPFIVHTNAMDIKVTGTAFNVRAYANERKTETTLIHGSVEVSLKNKGGKKIVLTPNEKLVVQNDYDLPVPANRSKEELAPIQLVTVKTDPVDSTATEMQWTKNRLVFDKETFSDIIPVLERWYDVKIDLKKSALSTKTFSGTFDNDSLEDVLESFKFSLGFSYSVQKKEVIIY